MTPCSKKLIARCVLAGCLVALAGCSGDDWGTMSGVVKVDGQPVGPGTILLEPVNGQGGGAMARFGEEGQYTVMSAGRKEGAAAGAYRVAIRGGEDFGAETSGPPPASDIPREFHDANSSGLTVTIESGSNTHDFDLSS